MDEINLYCCYFSRKHYISLIHLVDNVGTCLHSIYVLSGGYVSCLVTSSVTMNYVEGEFLDTQRARARPLTSAYVCICGAYF